MVLCSPLLIQSFPYILLEKSFYGVSQNVSGREPENPDATGNCHYSEKEGEITVAGLDQSGVKKLQCPECGTTWAAKIKGGKENILLQQGIA